MSTRENQTECFTLYQRHVFEMKKEHLQAKSCQGILQILEKVEAELETAVRARTGQHESAGEMNLLKERTQWIATLHREMEGWIWS